LLCHLRDT
jgi:hypothetical protein